MRRTRGVVSSSGDISEIFVGILYICLFGSWEVRIVKNCDRGLENTVRGRIGRAHEPS